MPSKSCSDILGLAAWRRCRARAARRWNASSAAWSMSPYPTSKRKLCRNSALIAATVILSQISSVPIMPGASRIMLLIGCALLPSAPGPSLLPRSPLP